MNEDLTIIGQSEISDAVNSALRAPARDANSFVIISGESSSGKSHILKSFHETAKTGLEMSSMYFRCDAPIGRINIGNIQPLVPFIKALDVLRAKKGMSAKKRFYLKASMTALSAIPILGDILAAVKDMGRDYREYKFDAAAEADSAESTTIADFYKAFGSITENNPSALFLDDFHYSDPQSIALLNMFAKATPPIPMAFIIAYKKSIADAVASPFATFVAEHAASANVSIKEIRPMTEADINGMARLYIPGYRATHEFESKILNRSLGNAGVAVEYMKYFKKNSPFLPGGELNPDFADTEYVPSSVHAAFSKELDALTEDDKNLLALCSAEGREFTAMIVSDLLKTDILQTIKMLRSIKNRTGIIASIGAEFRYGVKTTVYEFSQAFYHSHFENMLEFEEKTALHGQIAAKLKQLFETAESDTVKRQIAPFLAAHSSASGDEDTAKSMLIVQAKTAGEFGSKATVERIFEDFQSIESGDNTRIDPSAPGIDTSAFADIFKKFPGFDKMPGENLTVQVPVPELSTSQGESYIRLRNKVVNLYHEKNFREAAESALEYSKSNSANLRFSEQLQLLTIAVKSFVEYGDFGAADRTAGECVMLIEKGVDIVSESMFLNVFGLLRSSQGRHHEAAEAFKKAASKAVYLPPEMKLLTLANIAVFKKTTEPGKSENYFKAVKKLAKSLDFRDFMRDLSGDK